MYPPSSLQQHLHSLDTSGVVLPGDYRAVAGHDQDGLSSGLVSPPRNGAARNFEQMDARPRRCDHRRPKSQHEPWVHDNGYIFHRGNFMYNSQLSALSAYFAIQMKK